MLKKAKKYKLTLTSAKGPQTLVITPKRIKRIIFRYNADDQTFNVSTPYYTNQLDVKNLFYEKEKLILKLMDAKKAIDKDIRYFYGVKFTSYKAMLNLNKPINRETFYKLTKKSFLEYLSQRTAMYEKKMGIPITHKVRVRVMKTRWGTNAIQSRTITYNHLLIHYHPEIIDAIIIHELGHYYIGGHQQNFYNLIYRYSPNYDQLSKNLKRGNYANS